MSPTIFKFATTRGGTTTNQDTGEKMTDYRREMDGRRQQKISRFREQKLTGPSHQDLSRLYGSLVFDEAVPLVEEIAKVGFILESDHFEYFRDMMGDEFAGKVDALKQRIQSEVPDDHKGPFDGWVKHVARTEFGKGSDFAQQHGDQEINLLCLVLSNQAQRVADVRAMEQILGREVPPTKRAVGPLLGEFLEKIGETETAFKEHEKAGSPKWGDEEPFSKYLGRKSAYEQEMRLGGSRFKYLKGVHRRLTRWVTGEHGGEPRSKRDQLVAQIAGLQDQITQTKGEEKLAAERGEYGIAAEKKAERMNLEQSVRGLEQEIARLETPGKPAEVKWDLKDTQSEPIGKPVVTGDPDKARERAGDTDGKVTSLRAEVTRLKGEINSHEEAANDKECEAVEKSRAARAESDDEKAEGLLREARVLRQSARSSAEAAENLRRRVQEIEAEITRLETSDEPKPKKEKKQQRRTEAMAAEESTKPAEAEAKAATGPSANGNQNVTMEELERFAESVEDTGMLEAIIVLVGAARTALAKGKGKRQVELALEDARAGNVQAVKARTAALTTLAK